MDLHHQRRRVELSSVRLRASMARLLGVTERELAALTLLLGREPLTLRAIGSGLRLSSGGATTLVQRLARASQVTTAREPNGIVLVRLSPAARKRLQTLFEPLDRAIDEAACLAERDRVAVARYLELAAVSTDRYADELVERALRRDRGVKAGLLPGRWA